MILLKFDVAVEGDSTVNGHEKWITIDSCQLGVGRAITQSGGGQDRETSNPSFSEFSLSKSMDRASTELLIQATCGKSLGKATIDFIQTGGSDVKDQVFLQYFLTDPIISSYSVSSNGERPMESFTISFTKLESQYFVFKDGKQTESTDKKGWDLEKNQLV